MTLELEAVKKLIPKVHRHMVTQEFLDKIEESIGNPLIAETFKENFVSYIKVLQGGKYKMVDYINAVKYISFKLMGHTNIDAYVATFPDRYQRFKDQGVDQRTIDAYVSMYNSNKLVMQIYEQTVIPTHVLNQPLHQQALNTLARLISTPGTKGLILVKACEAILEYTKPPVDSKILIGVEQSDTIAELRQATEQLAETFRDALRSGAKTLKEITEINVIDAEYDEEDIKLLEETNKPWELK